MVYIGYTVAYVFHKKNKRKQQSTANGDGNYVMVDSDHTSLITATILRHHYHVTANTTIIVIVSILPSMLHAVSTVFRLNDRRRAIVRRRLARAGCRRRGPAGAPPDRLTAVVDGNEGEMRQ